MEALGRDNPTILESLRECHRSSKRFGC